MRHVLIIREIGFYLGNDILAGGAGNDSILDSDSTGSILYNSLTLSSGNITAPNLWQDTQGTSYTLLNAGAAQQNLLITARNGNGRIDDGSELFGDATPRLNAAGQTVGKTANGFAALAQEDTNHDGLVNAADANFANLKVWQDLNQDGISQSNELTSLAQQGIASLTVGSTKNSQMLPSGNQMADLGTFTRVDGSTGATGSPQGMADITHRTRRGSGQLTHPIRPSQHPPSADGFVGRTDRRMGQHHRL